MDPDPSSVMSRWEQEGSGTNGSVMEPSNTRVGKHSRSVAEIGRGWKDFFFGRYLFFLNGISAGKEETEASGMDPKPTPRWLVFNPKKNKASDCKVEASGGNRKPTLGRKIYSSNPKYYQNKNRPNIHM